MRASELFLVAAALASGLVVSARAQQAPTAQPQQEPSSLANGNAAHGRYLVERVAMCIECHSPRNARGDIIPGREFLGAPIPFRPPEGWAMKAPRNRGLLGYDDEEAFRLLTQGAIGRHGEQLRPPMPRFRMSRQDAADVIVYLRSLH